MRVVTVGMGGGLKKALPASGVTASLAGSIGYTNVSWTNPNPSTYDGWNLYYRLDGGSWVLLASSSSYGKATAAISNINHGSSYDIQYKVVTFFNGAQNGDDALSNTVRTAPYPPSINNFYASNPGYVVMDANPAGGVKISDYQVDLSTNGGSSYNGPWSSGADPDYTWSGVAHGTTAVGRVRTVDSFGQTSGWVYSGGVWVPNDTTAPTCPTVTGYYSGTGFYLSWGAFSENQSSIVGISLLSNWNGGGWNTFEQWDYDVSNVTDHYVGVPGELRGGSCQFVFYAIDSYGNARYGTASDPIQSRPYGTFQAVPIQSHSWGSVGWRSDTDDLYAGDSGSPNYTQTGFWFYGTQIADICKGFYPDRVDIWMQRNGNYGVSGYNYLTTHQHETAPTTPGGLTHYDAGPVLTGTEAYADYTLQTAAFRTGMADGSVKGIATTTSPGGFRRLRGMSSLSYSGRLLMYFYA